MTEAKQGPWVPVIEQDADYLDGIMCRMMVKNEAGFLIAYCFDEKHTRLAAAAPDMLAALNALDTILDFGTEAATCGCFADTSEFNAAMEKARASIAKATENSR